MQNLDRFYTTSDFDREYLLNLLNRVVNNSEHVLQPFLTERPQTYSLRRRPHGSKTLFEKTLSLNDQDFFIRTMYKQT